MNFTTVDSSEFYSQGGCSDRVDWPFKDMNINQCVEIDSEMSQRAQLYAHVYGKQSGKTFRTKKTNSGSMLVIRVA